MGNKAGGKNGRQRSEDGGDDTDSSGDIKESLAYSEGKRDSNSDTLTSSGETVTSSGSKPTKRKGSKTKSKDKDKRKDSNGSTTDSLSGSSGEDKEVMVHPSWQDDILYQGDTFKTKVTPDDFEPLHVIGNGSFGKVMQVRSKQDGQIYAMKVLSKEEIIRRKQVAHTRAEKSILGKMQHPFIVKLHHAFQTENKLYMILDFINGGELFFHLKREKRFPESRVRRYAAEIVLAVSHLHTFDIVYRDLKPENILLNSDGIPYPLSSFNQGYQLSASFA